MASIVKNCKITKSDAMITKGWSVGSEIHTGVDVLADAVHSVCCGVVIECGKSIDHHYSVTVQYDATQSVRYLNLRDVCVRIGQLIEDGQLLARADKSVHFEYVTLKNKLKHAFPVRIGTVTYYKQDPTDLVKGVVVLPTVGQSNVRVITNPVVEEYILTEEQLNEFVGKRGE